MSFGPNGPPRPELARSLVVVIRLTALVTLNLRRRAGNQGPGAYRQCCTGCRNKNLDRERCGRDRPHSEQFGSSLVAGSFCFSWKLLIRKEFWLRGVDLNHRPLGYEPNELPDCSTPHFYPSVTPHVRSNFTVTRVRVPRRSRPHDSRSRTVTASSHGTSRPDILRAARLQ